ncbi:MAG: 6-hydroxymethylpterin diphosphokinase MptE-like protein [Phycisphaerales bacterium JB039]
MPEPGDAILMRNLRALARTSPRAVERIRSATAPPQILFEPTDDEVPALALAGKWLTSRRRPLVEAQRLAETVEPAKVGIVVVTGFGAGYHIVKLAERIGTAGLIICFEPDVSLLRAALERIDVATVLEKANIILVTEADDTAALTSRLAGAEALLALGVQIVEHPPSRERLGADSARFLEMFTGVARSVRTTLVTTLVQSQRTLANELDNLGAYVTSCGVAELAGSLAGRPAIVVSAGPSLQRNIHLLAREGVRDRFLIIAVQTALKPLLAAGVRPHFVTALDYSAISARFYEGLKPSDVEGATLVIEPKASCAIPEAWPGALRMARSSFLDELLGVELAGDHGELRPGATVAHLAYYLARHLGCDPVILIGQDLGFTDGQYYASGAAIHNVWSSELSPLRTLEMCEHERIVRARQMLRPATDTLGRPVWTDEQMETYRLQFERDFAADAERGLRVIDATEGGVRKAHTEIMTLAEAIQATGAGPLDLPPAAAAAPDPQLRHRAAARCARIAADTRTVAQLSNRTLDLLRQMLGEADRRRLNDLIEQARAAGAEAKAINPAFRLVQLLNQTGSLKRVQADRAIQADALDPRARQQRQIERDITNVQWTADAADELAGMIERAAARLEGAAEPRQDAVDHALDSAVAAATAGETLRPAPVLILADLATGGLGSRRDLAEPLAGASPLQWTQRRIARCRLVDRVIIASQDPARTRDIAGLPPGSLRIEHIELDEPDHDRAARQRAIGAARRYTPASWRGGLAALTIWDEVLDPALAFAAMDELDLDEAVIVGADWPLVDPAIIDDIIRRRREDEHRRALVFSQAPPGLGALLVTRQIVSDLARSVPTAGPFASVGALLGYLPTAPRPDPIATGMCVACAPAVRDLGLRLVADSLPDRRLLERLLHHGCAESGADAIASAISARPLRDLPPRRLTLELCAGRLTSGERWLWSSDHEPPERPAMSLELAARIIEQLAELSPAGAVTFAGAGDPLQSPALLDAVAVAKGCGLAAHVRTDLLCSPERLDALLASGADIISVDLLATDAATYRRLQGIDAYGRVLENIERLLEARSRAGGVPHPWIVPRITRCDAVYQQIEPFYDHWLLRAGAAVIDPLPRPLPEQRIAPLALPPATQRRFTREHLLVLSTGVAYSPGNAKAMGNLSSHRLAELWRNRRTPRPAAALV